VIRGGSWNNSAANVRSANRNNNSPQQPEQQHWLPAGALLALWIAKAEHPQNKQLSCKLELQVRLASRACEYE